MKPDALYIGNYEYKELLLYMLFYSYPFYRREHKKTVNKLVEGNIVYIIVIAKTFYGFKTFEEFDNVYYEDCDIKDGPLSFIEIKEEWIDDIKATYDKVLVDGTYIRTFRHLLSLFPYEFSDFIITNALPYRLYEVGFIPHFIREKDRLLLIVYSQFGYWKAIIDEKSFLRLINVKTNMVGHDLDFLRTALY